MDEALRLLGYREPSGLFSKRVPAPPAHPDLRAFRIEFSSRGDRVTGRLWMPADTDREHPLVLLQHGAGGSSESEALTATAGPWVARGAAVASIDFPLHGQRADAKLGGHVAAALLRRGDGAPDPLVLEFARQAVIDLQRALDALEEVEGIDAQRIAYAGFSLGAMLGAAFCGLDPRPRAAVLALAGAGLAPASVDPARYVGRIAPRPVLLVQAERDATIPREAARALQRAAGGQAHQLWFDATHDALPGQALKAMWEFLAKSLALDAAQEET